MGRGAVPAAVTFQSKYPKFDTDDRPDEAAVLLLLI